jgi:hypothetical protein
MRKFVNNRLGIKASNAMSFDEFVERMEFAGDTCAPSRHGTQTDWSKDASRNIAIDRVYKLGELQENMNNFNSLTKIDMDNRYLDVNKPSKSNSYRVLYNDWYKIKIEHISTEDMENLNTIIEYLTMKTSVVIPSFAKMNLRDLPYIGALL